MGFVVPSGNEIRISPSISKVSSNLNAHIVCQNTQRINERQIKSHAILNIQDSVCKIL